MNKSVLIIIMLLITAATFSSPEH